MKQKYEFLNTTKLVIHLKVRQKLNLSVIAKASCQLSVDNSILCVFFLQLETAVNYQSRGLLSTAALMTFILNWNEKVLVFVEVGKA